MPDAKPGEIRQPQFAGQLRDFSGMLFERKITPTDVDCAVEFGGEEFVFADLKYRDTELPTGQRRYFENLVRAINKPCIVFVASHNDEAPSPIRAASAMVREYLCNGRRGRTAGHWKTPTEPITLLAGIQRWRAAIAT